MKRKRTPCKADETDRVLAALAHPVRRAILDDLDTHIGMSVAYLRQEIRMSRQGIRKHLGELIKAGIVTRWRGARTAIYYIDPRPIRRVFAALGRRYRRDLRPLGGFDGPW
jgi:DNA-binding transcriptional ArsR family regulator